MAHPDQFDFVQRVKMQYPGFFQRAKVLEVGSLDINGSIRKFYDDCDYLGIDVGSGRGVDLVVTSAHLYTEADGTFDQTVSCECFEHNPHWILTFANMIRMTRSGGLVIMTCATTGRPEHGTSRSDPQASPLTVTAGWDYYQNLTEPDFRDNFKLEGLFSEFEFQVVNTDLYFWGIKK
jgi:hypothetical protein